MANGIPELLARRVYPRPATLIVETLRKFGIQAVHRTD